MTTPVPNVAVWNLGNLYLQGMKMTWTDADTVTISQGQARDSTNKNDIVLARPPLNNGTAVTTGFTISTALVGAGGLDQGTIANNTLYYVYAIASSCNSAINTPPSPLGSLSVPPFTSPSPTSPVVQDGYYVQANVLFSTSLTNPLLPFGFDMFRRIGTVRTDGSANFLAFDQRGSGNERTITYRAALATDITSGSSATFAAVALTGLVPAIDSEVLLKCVFTPTAADDTLAIRCGDSATDEGQAVASGDVGAVAVTVMLDCPYSATVASGIDYKVTGSATAINVQGYVDQL
jgi:hypothetical protein